MLGNERRKLMKNILAVILVILLSLPFAVWWFFGKETPINVVILDKTVPVDNYREHKSFMWLLNNLKYVNSKTGKPFVYHEDYYGFFPLPDKKYAIKELPDVVKDVDLIYIADTYGVYTEDFYGENLRGERSKLIYGGLTAKEITSIEKGLNNSNILVAEYNAFATPTTAEARYLIENLLGVKWTGWIGRYFDDLSSTNTEVPLWLVRNYEKQYGKKWEFTGPGVAYDNIDDTVVVLQAGTDFGSKHVRVVFSPAAVSEYNVRNNIEYEYWFDIIEPAQDSQVLAEYHLDVTEEGAKKLNEYGLPSSSPAIVKRFAKYRTYYFAGDYADKRNIPQFWNYKDFRQVAGIGDFYWQVYYPLMQKVLTEIKHQ